MNAFWPVYPSPICVQNLGGWANTLEVSFSCGAGVLCTTNLTCHFRQFMQNMKTYSRVHNSIHNLIHNADLVDKVVLPSTRGVARRSSSCLCIVRTHMLLQSTYLFMSYKGEKGGRGKGGESGGKGYGGGKGEGKGGGKGGKGGKGPDYTPAARVETCPPPKVDAKMLPKTYVGPISWSGKDTERDGDGKFIEPKSKKGAGTSGTPTEVASAPLPALLCCALVPKST